MSKKINTPKEIKQNLKGFEDVFEDYIASEEFKELDRKIKEVGRSTGQYELNDFLEQENERLTSLDTFLTKKVSLKAEYPQGKKIIFTQKERKKLLTSLLCEEIKKSHSIFQKNITEIFNGHFS